MSPSLRLRRGCSCRDPPATGSLSKIHKNISSGENQMSKRNNLESLSCLKHQNEFLIHTMCSSEWTGVSDRGRLSGAWVGGGCIATQASAAADTGGKERIVHCLSQLLAASGMCVTSVHTSSTKASHVLLPKFNRAGTCDRKGHQMCVRKEYSQPQKTEYKDAAGGRGGGAPNEDL